MEERTVYEIGEEVLEVLKEKIDRLNRKAAKLGCAPIVINIVGEKIVKLDRKAAGTTQEDILALDDEQDEYVKVLEITVHGEAPIIAGWLFVATLQHEDGGTVIRNISGEDLPEQYRNVQPVCDHCGTVRRRKDTYIVRNTETGEYKQVGRTCIKDFTGHANPENYAKYMDMCLTLDDLMTNLSGGGFGQAPRYIDVEGYLAHVAACIRLDGWVSKAMAQEHHHKVPTAGIAHFYMFPKHIRTREQLADVHAHQPIQEDKELAAAALNWVRTELAVKTDKSDYEHNLVVLCSGQHTGVRSIGFVASAVASYQKHQARLAEKEVRRVARKNSDWVGEVGQRITVTVKVTDIRTIESQFGTTYLHMMADEQGNYYKWFASNQSLGKRASVTLKGTIKSHDEYNGLKSTVLTRCKEQ